MRRSVVVVGVMVGVHGAFAACHEFAAEPPASTPDGGENGTPPPADTGAGGSNDADVADAGSPRDAGLCGHCRSGHCYEDAGCFPLAFTTVGTYPGDLGANGDALSGLARADQICNNEGNADREVTGQFRAWLSSGTQSAISRLTKGYTGGASRPVVLVSGAVVISSYTAMVAVGAKLAPINLSAAGDSIPDGEGVWTGSSPSGERGPNSCENWTKATADQSGTCGIVAPLTRPEDWTNIFSAQPCNETRHLYCFEVVP